MMELVDPIADDAQVSWNVFDQQDNDKSDEELTITHGRSYQLRISASTSGASSKKPRPVLISSPVEFRILCSATVEIDEDHIIVSQDEVSESYTRLINIAVPDECPTGVASFVMAWHEPGNKRPSIAAACQVKIDGTYIPDLDTPVDREFTVAAKVKLDEVPPEQTAIMHIVAADSGKIVVKGWNRRVKKLLINLPTWDPIRLSDFTRQSSEIRHKEARQRVRNFSRTKVGADFIYWLKTLLDRFHNDLCLIIVDHTDLETPWEMLELGDEEYLGAKAKVARWLPVICFDEWHSLKVHDVEKQGTILSYLDDKELGINQTYLEHEALKILQRRDCKNSSELLASLQDVKPYKDVGLIYLGCHGYDGMVIKGLLEVFLARFASGYIGTLGKIGSAYASMIANRILQDASGTDSIQVAEVLRRLKEEAAEAVRRTALLNLSEEERQEREVKFLYAFMYVYYGNAMMRLRLMQAGDME